MEFHGMIPRMNTRRFVRIGIIATVLACSTSIAFAGPDMTVTECAFSPAQPKESDFVTITMTFKNVGDQPVVFNSGVDEWTARLAKTGVTETATSGGSRGRTLAPGATYTDKTELVRPGQLTPGPHSVLVTTDPTSRVQGDANRANNAKDCSLTITAGGTFPPDLIIQDLKVETSPATSANIALVGTVKNIGKGPAVLPVGTLVTARDFGDASILQQETLAPGAIKSFRITPGHLIQPAAYTFHLEVDPAHKIAGEIGGDNNRKDLFARVLYSGRPGELAPDLVIDSCVFDPPAPSRNQPIKLKITFKNVGTADARFESGSTRWKATYQGRTLVSNASNELIILKPGMTFSTGASEQIFAANALPAGTVDITAQIDSDGWVIESNETNNQKTCSITVK